MRESPAERLGRAAWNRTLISQVCGHCGGAIPAPDSTTFHRLVTGLEDPRCD